MATAKGLLDYGAKGDLEGRITCAFVADAVGEIAGKVFGREADWGIEPGALDSTRDFLSTYRAPEFLAAIDQPGPRHLDGDFELVQDTFRRFADEKLKPIAEHIHRTNGDIPEDIISDLAEMGAFGLSIPAEYGGYGEGGEGEYIGMVVATEELSRGSLCAGGSLITRPDQSAPLAETVYRKAGFTALQTQAENLWGVPVSRTRFVRRRPAPP